MPRQTAGMFDVDMAAPGAGAPSLTAVCQGWGTDICRGRGRVARGHSVPHPSQTAAKDGAPTRERTTAIGSGGAENGLPIWQLAGKHLAEHRL